MSTTDLITILRESHVLTLVAGVLASYLTNWIKNGTHSEKEAAVGAAVLSSVALAVADLAITGGSLSVGYVVQNSASVFTIATLYYKLLTNESKTQAEAAPEVIANG